jgi:hypothetical protein
MPQVSFQYRFRVRLPAPPATAYRWATDYCPDDPSRMGQVGSRRIVRLTSDALILTDTIREGRRSVRKSRLVRLMPGSLSWTNTHLTGPRRHSQFLYEISAAGRGASRLTFTGLQIERSSRPLSPRALAARARSVAREDAGTWRRLAREMARDLRRSRRT